MSDSIIELLQFVIANESKYPGAAGNKFTAYTRSGWKKSGDSQSSNAEFSIPIQDDDIHQLRIIGELDDERMPIDETVRIERCNEYYLDSWDEIEVTDDQHEIICQFAGLFKY